MTEADFRATSFGSVTHIKAVSETAKEFAVENFEVEGWQGKPDDFTSDTRSIMHLVDQLRDDGYVVLVE